MVHSEKLADAVKRNKKVGTWSDRLDNMKISRAEFCRDHDIDPSALSRHCAGRMNATWETVKKIEKALKKQGV